jgi:DNA-binding XRE family transcriptional regulator
MEMMTIRELRERAGLTQFELAVAIDVTATTVFNWEKGRSEPRASQVRAMAKLFNVSMDVIVFEPEEVKSAA